MTRSHMKLSQMTRSPALFSLSLLGLLGACDSGDDGQFDGDPQAAVHRVAGSAPSAAGITAQPGAAPEQSITGTEATTDVPEQITSTLIGSDGDQIGSVVIHPHRQGVRVDLHVEGLQPGTHAVHFHQTGECQPPGFESAGAHFDPSDGRHGMPDADEDMTDPDHHAGDMLNQTVNDLGQLDARITNQSVSINGASNPLLDADGSALVIHARADDYESQPAGAAGARVACAELAAVN